MLKQWRVKGRCHRANAADGSFLDVYQMVDELNKKNVENAKILEPTAADICLRQFKCHWTIYKVE